MHSAKWWNAEAPSGVLKEEYERDRAAALLQETSSIETRQGSWHEFNLWNSTLFYNRELPAFRWGNLAADSELFPCNLRTENLVKSIGDAMVSKASSQPLIPTPVPHSTSYTAKRAVEKFQKFIAATWTHTASENAAIQAFLDAYVSSIGAVEIIFERDTLSVQPIFFDNLIIDNRECTNRSPPRTIRKRLALPRVAVEAMYPEFKGGEQDKAYVEYREVAADWTILVEAWRKPDIRGNGGRHTVVCCNEILADEPWKFDWFPIVDFHWSDPGSGFFSSSGVEECIPYQVTHNELNDAIRMTQDICSRPRILAHANSGIDINQWDNEFGRILGYTGIEPKPFVWNTDLGALTNERERNRAAAYSYFGLSEMSANADLPQQVRLDSSAGVREFRNMEDARHLRLWTRFEQFRLTIARRFIDVLGAAGAAANSFKASYLGGQKASVDMISWEEVKEIQKEQYSWTLESVPLSSQSPAARRETLAAWVAQGKVKPTDDVSMIGNPDLERIDDQEMAGVDDIKRYMALMEDGKYESPAEYTNFVWGIPEVIANIKRLKKFTEGVHPMAIALHEKWILEAMNTQKSALAQMQMQAAPMPGFDPAMGVQGAIQ
jgi:hypothetical protein